MEPNATTNPIAKFKVRTLQSTECRGYGGAAFREADVWLASFAQAASRHSHEIPKGEYREIPLSIALYVDAAAQLNLAKRLDSLAFNLANAGTPGFLADGLKFNSMLSTTGGTNVAFPVAATDYVSLKHGAAQRTGNSLDVAVRGDGWLSVMTPDGPAYTRDGRLQIDASGEVRSVGGQQILDSGGAPLMIDPSGGDISVAFDGTVTQRGKAVGSIGLFTFDAGAQLTRRENSSIVPNMAALPVSDFSRTGLMQGYVEQANVNAITEMSRLIEIQRSFDHVSACMAMSDSTQQDAIRILGGQS